MAKFHDKNGSEWTIDLDPILIEEIESVHGVSLVRLEQDPMQKLRNDPMLLVSVVALATDEQRQERGISPRDFGRSMPRPPDAMLNAVREAIIDFFPSGRASHVREVLTESEKIAAKSDEVMLAEMTSLIENPETRTKLSSKARRELERAVNDLLDQT